MSNDTTDPRAAAEEALRLHDVLTDSDKGAADFARRRGDGERLFKLTPILARAVIEAEDRATERVRRAVADSVATVERAERERDAARAELAAAREEAEEAKLGDRLSEDQTSDLWHAIEAVAEGCSEEQWAKHRATLDTNGTDAEPLETIRAELASLRSAPPLTAAEWADLDERTRGPGPLAGDGRLLARLAAEVRRRAAPLSEAEARRWALRLDRWLYEDAPPGTDSTEHWTAALLAASRGAIPPEVRPRGKRSPGGTTMAEHTGHGCDLDPTLGDGDPLVDATAAREPLLVQVPTLLSRVAPYVPRHPVDVAFDPPDPPLPKGASK